MREGWHADRAGGWVSYWRDEPRDPSAPYISTSCVELSGASQSELEVDVAIEQRIVLVVGGSQIATLYTLPTRLHELALGYLLCEGLIGSLADVHSVHIRDEVVVCELATNRESTAQLSEIPPITSDVVMKREVVLSCVEELKKRAVVWRRTGGTHCSMVCTHGGDVMGLSEDVSRMCSVDRAVGAALLSGAEPSECALITTGRLSGAMVAKVARAGIPIMASKAAPLSGGVELARRLGMTLVGFVRSPNLYVYAGEQRIV
ncbi:MAG: formate dehydrogenase accessory sulfurtransferase FdhD [Methermicoccaceae archaeon]